MATKQIDTGDAVKLNLDEKVVVRSICPWHTSFNKLTSDVGAITFAPKGTARVSRAEIIAQIENNNRAFGIDDYGSHACLIIEDEATRQYLDFDSKDGKRKQLIVNEENLKKVFEYKTFNCFKKHFAELVMTRAEKSHCLQLIKKLEFNEYDKIIFAREHCKFSLSK